MKTTVAIVLAVVMLGAVVLLTNANATAQKTVPETGSIQNVSIVDGTQIIEISAKAGYTPRVSLAKANIPTILRFNTKGTFDCSSSIRIPSMNITQVLPNSGSTEIDIGNPKPGILQGTCGMGMYPFEINFE